eukprot:352893-Chlamydomonas_euryale.AAC.7
MDHARQRQDDARPAAYSGEGRTAMIMACGHDHNGRCGPTAWPTPSYVGGAELPTPSAATAYRLLQELRL